MRIYVIRHSAREYDSDEVEKSDGDPEAELTPEGEDIARAVGKWMADNDAIPSRIAASATVRTQRTAELIAKEIAAAGYAPPDVETDVSIGPHQSIRGLVQKLAADKSANDVAIVSHHESIDAGLKALSVDNDDKYTADKLAMGEMRALKVKRKSGRWKETARVRPSDVDQTDYY